MISLTKRAITAVIVCYTTFSLLFYFTSKPPENTLSLNETDTTWKANRVRGSLDEAPDPAVHVSLEMSPREKADEDNVPVKSNPATSTGDDDQPDDHPLATTHRDAAVAPARTDKLAPCGEVCSYEGRIVPNRTYPYQQLSKHIDCDDIMRRMAYRGHPIINPPPTSPPKELYKEFTMNGKSPISTFMYKKSLISKDKVRHFTTGEVNEMLAKLEKGEDVNSYSKGECAKDTLKKYASTLTGGRGVVIGSINPWLESILLSNGAAHVTTLEYAPTDTDDPRLDVHDPYEFAEKYLAGKINKFDFGASFSSIEHSGLGRYTDPLNPYGDLEAMAQVWCMIKPGGLFGLGVPRSHDGMDKDSIVWNAHRVYGSKRLQHLTANWKVEDRTACGGHHFFVLSKQEES